MLGSKGEKGGKNYKEREDGRKWRQEVGVYLYLLYVLGIHFTDNVGIL